MRLAIILIVLVQALLSGCSTLAVPHDVKVPFTVPCVRPDQVPPQPQFTSKPDILKLDRRKRTLTIWDERIQLKADDDALRALLSACEGGK